MSTHAQKLVYFKTLQTAPGRVRVPGGTRASNRDPVEGVERGDHGYAHDGQQRAKHGTRREPGEGELKADADGCRARGTRGFAQEAR
jgi:hypothetical protein